MSLATGSHLGTYQIVAPLGRGGMGEVYRARDLRLGREVAIKVLPAGVADDAERLARFEREARAVAALNHPNIVVLYSIEDEEGVRFLTMELVEGEGLERHIAPGGLPVARVLDLGIALADALAAAHARGVVHRDLKPANVMLTREGRVKVLDFGLAKLGAESEGVSGATQAATMAAPLSGVGQVMGTVPYMAPEQLRGEPADARTDLFALGILLYEVATGRRPFAGATNAEVTSAILRDPPEPLARARADVPADLDRLLSRCLEKDPRARAQTALEVANELRQLRHALEAGGRAAPAAPTVRAVASIAVLPFVNRSRDEDDEYFADGLADELIGVLSRIRGLRVAARTSSSQFKGTTDALPVIGQKLNVATLVEGSVRKSGNRVRISVQLVNVADGYHLWSETYDRTLDDIFAVQDDIAQSVVKELRRALLGEEPDSKASGEARAEVAAAARGRGANPEAHRLYLQGKFFADRSTREDFAKAANHFRRALELDPGLALAWTGLATVHYGEGSVGALPSAEALRLAREAVDRALALEPELPEALDVLVSLQLTKDRDWAGAERTLARLRAVAPDGAAVLSRGSQLALTLGRLEEAARLGRRACETDPLGVRNYLNLGFALHMLRRFDEAEAAFRKALELNPDRMVTHSSLALVLLDQGRHMEALAEAEAEPEVIFRIQVRAIVLWALGRRDESGGLIRQLERDHAHEAATQVAEAYAAVGEADRAFEWLERALETGDTGISQLRYSSCFVGLQGDPRFAAWVRRLGLES